VEGVQCFRGVEIPHFPLTFAVAVITSHSTVCSNVTVDEISTGQKLDEGRETEQNTCKLHTFVAQPKKLSAALI